MTEMQRDKIAYWVAVENVEEKIETAKTFVKAKAEAMFQESGYQAHPTLKPLAKTSDQHADFFTTNRVMVMYEIPVLLTRKQWLIRHLPGAEKNLEHAINEVAKEVPRSTEQTDELLWDVDYWQKIVDAYRQELKSLD